MNTTENNRLIAEFLGWKLGHPELLELRWSNEWFNGSERKTNKGFLHFDTDWNQLMEVVKEIALNGIGGGVTYGLRSALLEADIDKAYLECVEYIKFVNDRNTSKNFNI